MRINKIHLLLLLAGLIVCLPLIGQTTRIRGKIIDKSTNEVLPFVNIALKGTTAGTISDFNGEFFLETRQTTNTLTVSYVGYHTYVQNIKPGSYQTLVIFLEPESIELNEVVIVPGENPAHVLLRQIIDSKKGNNPERLPYYSYEIYNKMELDVNNISAEYKNQKALKQFQFIFDYVDTSAVTGKTFLPIFITETLSDFYYQKQPKKRKEIIKANSISGVSSDQVSDFTGQMYLDFNIYSNYVSIMGKNMVSPIANFGLMYYKYYLIDSTYRNNKWCYNISFRPKRKQEPTFTGNFWVNDTTFAIESYKIRLAEDVNINFVDDFVAEQSYTIIADSIWFPKKQELFVDFEITNKEYGFFGRKTTSYANIKLEQPNEPNFFSGKLSQETILKEGAQDLSIMAWDTLRHEKLTQKEKDIYVMVDSIQEMPLYNNIISLINTLITGYWVKDPIEIGPYYTLYSFNPIEGHRLKLGMRTSNQFSTKLMLYGHLAYGTRDKELKYGIGSLYMFKKNPRRAVNVFYLRDYELLGVSQNAFRSDNFLSSIFSRKVNDKLTTVNEVGAYYEHEWFQGLSNTLHFKNRVVYSSPTVPFQIINNNDTLAVDKLVTTELTLNTRFAYNEKFIMGEFERQSLGTKFPILNVDFTTGIQGLFDSDFEYYKLHFSIEHKFPIGTMGDFRYIIDVGRVYGKVPFPFLQLHEGNQTYAYDEYAFNLMNYYEFVSNKYATFTIEHHFNGLFLNHIPLFRKLKWREVVSTKILTGDITQRDNNYLLFPQNLSDLSKPYVEAGVGLENIFKFFRIDAVWRLSYLDNPDIMPFGILAKMQVRF